MISFWRQVFARWDPVEAPRRAGVAPDGRPFPDAVLIGWAVVIVILFAVAGLPTPGAAQTYTCPATSAAADALCGNAPTCTIRTCDIDRPEEVLPFRRAEAGPASEWP